MVKAEAFKHISLYGFHSDNIRSLTPHVSFANSYFPRVGFLWQRCPKLFMYHQS